MQVVHHPAAGPVQRRVMHGGAALGSDEQRDVVGSAAEHVRLRSVERERSGRLPVGAQRQHQAAGESGLGGGPAEARPAALGRRVVHPPRLVVPQRLGHRPVTVAGLPPVQFLEPLIRGGEGQRAAGHGDRHRRGGTAGHQSGPQGGQPVQHIVRDVVRFEQLSDLGDAISELPGNGDHGTAPYPPAGQSCARCPAWTMKRNSHPRSEVLPLADRVASRPGMATCAGLLCKKAGADPTFRTPPRAGFSPGLRPGGSPVVDVLE